MKFGNSFLNKFAATLCKRFPPHLINVSTLPCESWNVHCAGATSALSEKETSEFISSQLWPPNSPDLNPLDYSALGILQEKVYKTCFTDPDELKQRRRYLQISVACFAIFPTRCYQLDSSMANLEATVEVREILEFLYLTTVLNRRTCAMSISSFTR